MAKYSVTDTSLSAVADAIRAKGGTTDAMAFPEGFVTAIESMQTGDGEVSLDIVTAAELPTTVTDGRIVVITTTTPSTIYVDTDEPASPAESDVWLKIGADGQTALELTSASPYLRNGFEYVSQYSGGAWAEVYGYVGMGGEWVVIADSLPAVGTTLEDCTWEEIAKISERGLAAEYFSVGDRKKVTLSGKVDNITLNGEYYCFIAGIYHNAETEGSGIHFQFAASADTIGKALCFTDANQGTTGNTDGFITNDAGNTGGWAESYMRNTICPKFEAALPAELQSVLKTCTKFTDNVGGTTNAASNVSLTSDKVWIPSEFEIHGTRTYANSAEQTYQAQYAYYAAGNSKIKYGHAAQTTAMAWWTRSPGYEATSYFCAVSKSGNAQRYSGASSYGFAPMFMV